MAMAKVELDEVFVNTEICLSIKVLQARTGAVSDQQLGY